jgi:UDP-N-acetylglucosamine diphosphorylase/glucosamine-1-phosphate N-acetyltransferase
MTTSICIVEDQAVNQFFPLTYLRPVYDLRCGIATLRQKIERAYPNTPVVLQCRTMLADVVRQQNPHTPVNMPPAGSCLFLNGRILARSDMASQIAPEGQDCVYVHGTEFVAARVSGPLLKQLFVAPRDAFGLTDFGGLPRQEVAVEMVHYPWDLVNKNGEQIQADYRALDLRGKPRNAGTLYPGAHVLNPNDVVIGEGAKIKPGVVLDAEQGPIVIGAHARIFPQAVIEGPAWIGDNTLIKIGAKIYENTSIGPVCKVGGEVEGSIIHAYANKQHDGFLGHAYLCPWVNLGADTNNSDLKNNYGNVRVTIDGKALDSGSLFVGLIMGDHAKSGINTMFNTGTVVGVGSNVFGAGFPPKAVPSFSWGGAEGLVTYDLEKCLAVARRVVGRRKMTLTDPEEQALRAVFAMTAKDRKW